MRVCHVIHACSERFSSTLSSPFHPTSSSSHSSSISCSPSCASCTTSRAVVTLRTSPERRWTPLTNPTSSQMRACEEEFDVCSSLPRSLSAESEFDAGVVKMLHDVYLMRASNVCIRPHECVTESERSDLRST